MNTATFGLLASLFVPVNGPLELDPEETRPGLIAEFRSLAGDKSIVTQIVPKSAFQPSAEPSLGSERK